MLFKIKCFTGFDKSQSYGLFSIYMESDRPWDMELISAFVQAFWLYDITVFSIFTIFGFGIRIIMPGVFQAFDMEKTLG
jgi:hypothetical protein